MYVCMYVFIYLFYIVFIFNFYLISYLCIEISIQQSLRTPLCFDPKCTFFLCAPSCVFLNQFMPLFLNFGLVFYSQPIYSYFIFLLAVSPAVGRCVFLFAILQFFLLIEIYIFQIFFSFIFTFQGEELFLYLMEPKYMFQ